MVTTKTGKQRESTATASLARAYRFNLCDLFDRLGRLRSLADLPAEIAAEIASFDVVRITTRTAGETVTTEELIRVKTRDRRTAAISRRGGSSFSPGVLRSQPLTRGLVTVRERSAGAGRTEAAEKQTP
jgi:hypothetical protein